MSFKCGANMEHAALRSGSLSADMVLEAFRDAVDNKGVMARERKSLEAAFARLEANTDIVVPTDVARLFRDGISTISNHQVKDGITVGTALAGGPPCRSQRALLTHWAPAAGSDVESITRPGMRLAGGRKPPS